VHAAVPLDLRHEPASHRFVARAAGAESVLEYRADGMTLDCYHTFVPPALRGGGIASRLTEFALRHARDNGLKVRPTCPFIARCIERHPEFQPLFA
jgi:predicted GNAT family acetyltransferase